MTPTSQLMTPVEAAEYLGVSANSLETWRCTNRYALKYVKVGGRVKYRQSDLDAFLAARTVTPGQTTMKPRQKRAQKLLPAPRKRRAA